MSLQLINHSPDLKQLLDEGYDIEIRSGYLLLKNVPYVDAQRNIKYGTLVSKLTLANNITTVPDDHVAYFSGEYPCHQDGSAINKYTFHLTDSS
jgi:hypothetical protein